VFLGACAQETEVSSSGCNRSATRKLKNVGRASMGDKKAILWDNASWCHPFYIICASRRQTALQQSISIIFLVKIGFGSKNDCCAFLFGNYCGLHSAWGHHIAMQSLKKLSRTEANKTPTKQREKYGTTKNVSTTCMSTSPQRQHVNRRLPFGVGVVADELG